jgi:hypothetical protein
MARQRSLMLVVLRTLSIYAARFPSPGDVGSTASATTRTAHAVQIRPAADLGDLGRGDRPTIHRQIASSRTRRFRLVKESVLRPV